MKAKDLLAKPPAKKANVVLNARVSPEVAEKVHELKKASGYDLGYIIEQALIEFMEDLNDVD